MLEVTRIFQHGRSTFKLFNSVSALVIALLIFNQSKTKSELRPCNRKVAEVLPDRNDEINVGKTLRSKTYCLFHVTGKKSKNQTALDCSTPINGKKWNNVVISLFSVCPKPRTIPMTVINKSMKTRLQSIVRRVRLTFHSGKVNTSCVMMVHKTCAHVDSS